MNIDEWLSASDESRMRIGKGYSVEMFGVWVYLAEPWQVVTPDRPTSVSAVDYYGRSYRRPPPADPRVEAELTRLAEICRKRNEMAAWAWIRANPRTGDDG